MKQIGPQEFRRQIAAKILSGELEPETDMTGQLMFLTGWFENVEGEIQDTEDPEFNSEEEL